MKVTVMGCGYVGLSLAVLLSTKVEVVACDINQKKVDSYSESTFFSKILIIL